jgi:hypothetical protein
MPIVVSASPAANDVYRMFVALNHTLTPERIDPRDTWEQETLYEFEGFVVLDHLHLLIDEIK